MRVFDYDPYTRETFRNGRWHQPRPAYDADWCPDCGKERTKCETCGEPMCLHCDEHHRIGNEIECSACFAENESTP